MGVTIHYRGQIKHRAAIYNLIEEVEEIVNTQGWRYYALDENWQNEPTARLESADGPGIQIVGQTGLKGLRFNPHPDCEPIWLFFNKSGILTTPFPCCPRCRGRLSPKKKTGFPPKLSLRMSKLISKSLTCSAISRKNTSLIWK